MSLTPYEQWELEVWKGKIMDKPFPDGMMPCIEKFFKEVHPTLKPGQDSYPEVFHSDLFFPLQRMKETAKMIQEARKANNGSPRVVMEIGADKGGGVYHWCQSLVSVQYVIACEIRGTPYARVFEKAFPEIKFLWLDRSSLKTETAQIVKDWLHKYEQQIDVLFIDGDKSFFYDDFRMYRPMVRSGGRVFFHDINEVGRPMKAAFDRVKAEEYKWSTILDTSESQEADERARALQPTLTPYEAWLRYWKGHSCGVGVIEIP